MLLYIFIDMYVNPIHAVADQGFELTGVVTLSREGRGYNSESLNSVDH